MCNKPCEANSDRNRKYKYKQNSNYTENPNEIRCAWSGSIDLHIIEQNNTVKSGDIIMKRSIDLC